MPQLARAAALTTAIAAMLAVPSVAAAAPVAISADAGAGTLNVSGNAGNGTLTVTRSGATYTFAGTLPKSAGSGCSLVVSDVVCTLGGQATDLDLLLAPPGGPYHVTLTGDLTTGAQTSTVTFGDAGDLLEAETFTAPLNVTAGAGIDRIDGGTAGDTIDGGDDSDLIEGGGGDDVLHGGGDNDVFLATDGVDGNDAFYGDGSVPDPDFAAATNTVSYTYRSGGVTATASPLPGSSTTGNGAVGESDTFAQIGGVVGGTGPNVLTGSAGRDYLVGGEHADTIRGFAGDDQLTGRFGADTLLGGAGADFIEADRTPMDPVGDDTDTQLDCGNDGTAPEPQDKVTIDPTDPVAGGCELVNWASVSPVPPSIDDPTPAPTATPGPSASPTPTPSPVPPPAVLPNGALLLNTSAQVATVLPTVSFVQINQLITGYFQRPALFTEYASLSAMMAKPLYGLGSEISSALLVGDPLALPYGPTAVPNTPGQPAASDFTEIVLAVVNTKPSQEKQLQQQEVERELKQVATDTRKEQQAAEQLAKEQRDEKKKFAQQQEELEEKLQKQRQLEEKSKQEEVQKQALEQQKKLQTQLDAVRAAYKAQAQQYEQMLKLVLARRDALKKRAKELGPVLSLLLAPQMIEVMQAEVKLRGLVEQTNKLAGARAARGAAAKRKPQTLTIKLPQRTVRPGEVSIQKIKWTKRQRKLLAAMTSRTVTITVRSAPRPVSPQVKKRPKKRTVKVTYAQR